jgi:hypothetical protein
MTRRARNQLIADIDDALAWTGLVSALVAFGGYPQALIVTGAVIAVQSVWGLFR